MSPDFQLAFGLCLVFILLVPFAIAGLALINAGLGRSRSAAHAMTSALCVIAVAFLIYFVWGFRVQGYQIPSQFLGPWYDALSPQPGMFLFGLGFGSPSFAALLGIFSVALACLVPLGATADRLRLSGACFSTLVLAGLCYPLFAHLASHLGADGLFKGFDQFVDAGGSGVINATGGLTALSIAWLIGPRQGKYPVKGMPAAIPAHNGVYVLFGCLLAWVGWLGLNSAGALLYAGMRLQDSVVVMANTTFSAAAAALTAAVVTRVRFRRPDASLIANGWMAGLVASSAGCAMLKPALAIITGIVAGGLVVLSVEWFELHLKVDDPCGSISVHGVCGIWGLLAAGIFSGSAGQFTAQVVGIATLLGLIFPMTYGLNWLLSRVVPYRISADGERQGLDLHELGADAYPEFMVHSDEFLQR
jgi:Amt family ammonium transporter